MNGTLTRGGRRRLVCAAAALLFLGSGAASAQAPADLVGLSLEELMDVEVSLTARKEERLFETASAVFALTREDLRRAGARTIPDALRLVPGMQVGQIDANKWAVSARGFADRFTNKMLVLIDGRQIYSPLFGGVWWESRDVLLADVARIEVVRGPGATLWGANAINGIINIVTVEAEGAQGGLVRGGVGSEERLGAAVRYGGRLGGGAHYQIYGKFFDRDAFAGPAGRGADDWRSWRTGFRVDGPGAGRDGWSVRGGVFGGTAGQTYQVPALAPPFVERFADDTDLEGGHLVASWRRAFAADSDLRVQAYFDRSERADRVLTTAADALDFDLQHRFSIAARHDLVWGVGYRRDDDETAGSFKLAFDPPARTTHLLSGFVHDEIALAANRLRLALGVKLERNSYSGFEYQPGARLLWLPDPRQALWAAVTRPVRSPARADQGVRLAFRAFPSVPADVNSTPILARLYGTRDFSSEKLLAYEAGYRLRPSAATSFDVAIFYNQYSRLRATLFELQPRPQAEVPHIELMVPDANLMDGTTYGAEVAVEGRFQGYRGRLRAAYAYLHAEFDLPPESDPISANSQSVAPEHQFYVWASYDLRPDVQLDAIGRYVGAVREHPGAGLLPGIDVGEYLPMRSIDAYGELDLRLGWRAARALEVELAGRNLLADSHREFTGFFVDAQPTRPQRGVSAAIIWTY